MSCSLTRKDMGDFVPDRVPDRGFAVQIDEVRVEPQFLGAVPADAQGPGSAGVPAEDPSFVDYAPLAHLAERQFLSIEQIHILVHVMKPLSTNAIAPQAVHRRSCHPVTLDGPVPQNGQGQPYGTCARMRVFSFVCVFFFIIRFIRSGEAAYETQLRVLEWKMAIHNYRTRLVKLDGRILRKDEELLDEAIAEQVGDGWFLQETRILSLDRVLFVFRKSDI